MPAADAASKRELAGCRRTYGRFAAKRITEFSARD
jgi:hypothetical protein